MKIYNQFRREEHFPISLQKLPLQEINNFKIEQKWPTYDENLLIEDKIKIVIQINGKKRTLMEVMRDIEENKLLEQIKRDKLLFKYIENKEFKKVIFVKNRLINIII